MASSPADIARMNALVHTIRTSVWLMHESSVEGYLPSVAKLLQGGDVKFYDTPPRGIHAYHNTVGRSPNCEYYNINKAPTGSVLVIPIRGAIMKDDGFCGEMGTESMMAMLRKAERMTNISGYLLEIDSGGGQATNIETVANFIRTQVRKPVVALTTGMAASAAYWMAAAADEVYASQPTNFVGSIGAMFTMMDFREALEKEGVKVHEIYASQSDLKNKDFKDARDGDYDRIKATLLDPMAQSFIDGVKALRPNLTDEDAYRGEFYSARDAERIGMIDGIITYEQAVDRVLALAQSIETTNKLNDMERIESVLGYSLESKDGGVFLQEHELAKLNEKLVAGNAEVVESDSLADLQATITALTTKTDNLESELGALRTQLDSNGQRLEQMEQDLEAYAKNPGDIPTGAFSEADPDETDAPDGYDQFEAEMQKVAESGNRIVITK